MCVGEGWKGIASIWVDPSGKHPAYIQPAGRTVMFYASYHGSDFLEVSTHNIPRYAQPYSVAGYPAPASPVAYLDVIATASKKAVFVHVINRYFDKDVPVKLDLAQFTSVGHTAVQHCYLGRLQNLPSAGESDEVVKLVDVPVTAQGKTLMVTLPKRSISIIEIPVSRE